MQQLLYCADGAGSTLRDVTEAVGLVANERSLACACLADRLLVQVMHKRMQLCSMDAVLAPDQGGLIFTPLLLASLPMIGTCRKR